MASIDPSVPEAEPLDQPEVEAAERLAWAVEQADAAEDRLPSTGLLSFYDRLRARMHAFLERKTGSLGPAAAEALLFVPDVFILLVRLSLDKEVPKSTRALIASALAYFVLPVDLLPEALLGPAGFMDDLVLGLSVLSHAFGPDLEVYTARYWSGSQPLRKVLGDVLEAAKGLLSADVYRRLRDLLARQGIRMDAPRADLAD